MGVLDSDCPMSMDADQSVKSKAVEPSGSHRNSR
jgi:hypothetical protein